MTQSNWFSYCWTFITSTSRTLDRGECCNRMCMCDLQGNSEDELDRYLGENCECGTAREVCVDPNNVSALYCVYIPRALAVPVCMGNVRVSMPSLARQVQFLPGYITFVPSVVIKFLCTPVYMYLTFVSVHRYSVSLPGYMCMCIPPFLPCTFRKTSSVIMREHVAVTYVSVRLDSLDDTARRL